MDEFADVFKVTTKAFGRDLKSKIWVLEDFSICMNPLPSSRGPVLT